MRIPDCITPIVAYRLWQWDAAGLKSLNGEPWIPGQPLAARCRALPRRTVHVGSRHVSHDAPQADCQCGVYGSKSLELLRSTRFWNCGVRGQVFLWGLTVEHEHGFRSQLAYPRSLYLPLEAFPVTLAEIDFRLQSLVPYRRDIFVACDGGSIPLWGRRRGLEAAGLDFLMSRGKEWYARRNREKTLKHGDRIAVLGRGIAVVEQLDGEQLHAVLCERDVLRMSRKAVAWHQQNMRWEASPSDVVQTGALVPGLSNRGLSQESRHTRN